MVLNFFFKILPRKHIYMGADSVRVNSSFFFKNPGGRVQFTCDSYFYTHKYGILTNREENVFVLGV